MWECVSNTNPVHDTHTKNGLYTGAGEAQTQILLSYSSVHTWLWLLSHVSKTQTFPRVTESKAKQCRVSFKTHLNLSKSASNQDKVCVHPLKTPTNKVITSFHDNFPQKNIRT